jgi:hypothetical protein
MLLYVLEVIIWLSRRGLLPVRLVFQLFAVGLAQHELLRL